MYLALTAPETKLSLTLASFKCIFHSKAANTRNTMDPLSFGASIIAILGAAATAGQTMEKLCSLRHAPDDLIALINEVIVHTPSPCCGT